MRTKITAAAPRSAASIKVTLDQGEPGVTLYLSRTDGDVLLALRAAVEGSAEGASASLIVRRALLASRLPKAPTLTARVRAESGRAGVSANQVIVRALRRHLSGA